MEGLVKRRMRRLLLLILSITSLTGCTESIYSDVVDFADEKWMMSQSAVFEFSPIEASLTSEISVFVRTTVHYKGEKIRLMVKTIDPERKYWQDVVVVPVENRGGMFTTSRFIVRQGISWSKDGTYAISIRPEENLTGIQAIGIEITNARDKQTTN